MAKAKKQKINTESYDQCFSELERMRTEFENNSDISFDVTADYAKNSVTIVRACKQKLAETQNDIDLFLKELESDK